MRTLLSYACPVAFLIVFAGCVATAPPTTQDFVAEVQRASDQYFAARERGDVAALASHVADDVVFMVPGLTDATGRDKFREVMQQRLANVRITDFKIEQREITVTGDTAHELGWFSEANR